MKITYYLSTLIFGPTLVAILIERENTGRVAFLIVAALMCLWLRITYLIPSYLHAVKRIMNEEQNESSRTT